MSAPQPATQRDGAVNPLLDALPPATDYISYATIVEQYLTRDNVPILEGVLQDEKLCVNIGWDLVHLLLPLLPDSHACLMTIARQGNPREVLLKATESLRLLNFDDTDEDNDDQPPRNPQGSSERLIVQQVSVLLSMLSLLHARIKTKYPSRFLSTTISAALATLSNAPQYAEVLVPKFVEFVSTLHGQTGPALPPRQPSATVNVPAIASDPEAQSEHPSVLDKRISGKLLQACVTDLCEVYVNALPQLYEVPGLGLADRSQERLASTTILPRRATVSEKFYKYQQLRNRQDVVKSLYLLTAKLGLSVEALLSDAAEEDSASKKLPDNDEDAFPENVDDVVYSRVGTILLAASSLFELIVLEKSPGPEVSIFPQHLHILRNIAGAGSAQEVSLLPEFVIDALLTLGLIALSQDCVGAPESDEQFNEYLQFTSLISANCPAPSLRFLAHYITSTVLRSHPDENVRLAFIKDTLEHCPFENVKTTAVTWIKGEILEANPPGATNVSSSIFATPVGLDLVAANLFPDLSIDLTAASIEEGWTLVRINLSFYLACLNFYYLLLSAKHLHERLAIKTLHSTHDIGGSFLGPLKEASRKFDESLAAGQLRAVEGQAEAEAGRADLMILNDVLERIDGAVLALNQE